jgi:Zn finger protein HypA/HybF involved in hydrogenase expression
VHELAITEGVVEAVTDRLPGARITCVRLEIGALSGVAADSVRFCFDLVTDGTDLQGARLEITEPAGRCSAGYAAASSSRTGRSCCAPAAAPTSRSWPGRISRSRLYWWPEHVRDVRVLGQCRGATAPRRC